MQHRERAQRADTAAIEADAGEGVDTSEACDEVKESLDFDVGVGQEDIDTA